MDEHQMLLKEISSFTAYRRKVLALGESWLTTGKVSKWEGNKWESCLTNGEDRA